MSETMTQVQNDASISPKKRAAGWWYPWIFVGFFAVIVTVNGIMMFFAFSSWSGLETEGHYSKGLVYDDNIAATKAQKALGWDVELQVKTLETQGLARKVGYQVTFLDHNKKPIEAIKAHTYFMRPTHEGVDQNGPAVLIGPGVIGGEVDLSMAGQWTVRVYAESKSRKYQLVERIVVK